MPISATGTSSKRAQDAPSVRQSGFTLLELLVVVAIIGVFVGVAVLSTDFVNFDHRIRREAERLNTVIKYTAEESLMQSRDFGILFFRNAYRFAIYDPNTLSWRPLDDGGAFAAHELPEDMVLELTMEDQQVELDPYSELYWEKLSEADDGQADDEQADDEQTDNGQVGADRDAADRGTRDAAAYPTPQVMIFSSGEMTAFDLEFLRESDVLEPGLLLAVEFDGKAEISKSEY